jgi:hypothetical protein
VPASDDGLLEVIGLYTYTLVSLFSRRSKSSTTSNNFFLAFKAKINIGGSGERICQARHIRLVTTRWIPVQIDGEPVRLSPSIIEIKHKNQALMLERVKSAHYYNKK